MRPEQPTVFGMGEGPFALSAALFRNYAGATSAYGLYCSFSFAARIESFESLTFQTGRALRQCLHIKPLNGISRDTSALGCNCRN